MIKQLGEAHARTPSLRQLMIRPPQLRNCMLPRKKQQSLRTQVTERLSTGSSLKLVVVLQSSRTLEPFVLKLQVLEASSAGSSSLSTTLDSERLVACLCIRSKPQAYGCFHKLRGSFLSVS